MDDKAESDGTEAGSGMLELGLVGLQMRALRHLEGAVGRANGGENHCAVKMCVRKKKRL